MECVGLRYFNIFGPNQNPNGVYAAVIPKFINLMLNDEQPTVNGDGLYSRDFTFVDNAVSANILALSTTNNKAFGKVFNIGNEGRITIDELIKSINSNLNKNIKPNYVNTRDGDIPHSNANIDKAKTILGYKPLVDFDTGIKLTIKFLQS
jgi:UDP-N-acetylglucosamine 4-epimerase